MKHLLFILLAAALLFPDPSPAQQTEGESAGLSVELNAADPVGETCRLTFVLRNDMDVDIDQLTVETVLFSKEGQVVLLTLFDFAAIPVGRPRVRQFQVPNVSCDSLGMVLVNGADTCSGDGLDPATCESTLSVSSRTNIALEG